MIVHKVHDIAIKEVEDVGTSERGEKGFGSTGRF
jgi:dUTPase